jgi:hypothetical protein
MAYNQAIPAICMEVFMAKRAKASEPSEPEHEVAIVPVEDPVIDPPPAAEPKPELPPPPPPPPPSPPVTVASGPSFGERVGRFFRFILRLVFLLIVLAALSLALYFALPLFYETFVRPVEQNTSQVRELQSWREQADQQWIELQPRLEAIETAQNEYDQSLTDLDQRVVDIESEITARTESLEALERLQAELEAQSQEVSAELERQINLLKSMELLSRARLSLYQSNFGLARDDVRIARDLLVTVREDAPEELAEQLDAVVQRLDLTLSNLPNFPVAASDDLDIAWQILLAGLPDVTPTISATPTLVSTVSATPSGFDLTITPTAPATLPPTPTP